MHRAALIGLRACCGQPTVSHRAAALTYGTAVSVKYDLAKHGEGKGTVISFGVELIDNVFIPLVLRSDVIPTDLTIERRLYYAETGARLGSPMSLCTARRKYRIGKTPGPCSSLTSTTAVSPNSNCSSRLASRYQTGSEPVVLIWDSQTCTGWEGLRSK